MKISLGLILFTMISAVLVYAETSDNTVVQIIENAHVQENAANFDNSLFSSSPGATITIVNNNDIVSHTFVSGNSNSNNEGKINYDVFLLCELNEKIRPAGNNYGLDDNLCDFNKDDRIITDIVLPGNSVSFSLVDVGTYRIIDPDYPWMEFVIYSFPNSESKNINSGFPVDDKISEQTLTESTLIPSTETLSVTIDGTPFDIEYTAIGLNVYEIESDTDSMSLIFYVNVDDSSGKLNVKFEREFFDSIYDGEDDIFFVLTDGDETISKEIETTSQSRSLTIDVPSGTEELEIIGSTFNNNEFELVVETPIVETPIVETPIVETPIVETPIVETPIVETPIVETPIVENSNQCGPGTVLENNICILDKRCGPGTVLENQICILDSTPTKSSSIGNTKELIMSVTVAFVIAGIIGIVFALISKANRNKN